MGSKARLSTYCAKRRENPANHVTSRKINTGLACPIALIMDLERELIFFKCPLLYLWLDPTNNSLPRTPDTRSAHSTIIIH